MINWIGTYRKFDYICSAAGLCYEKMTKINVYKIMEEHFIGEEII